MISCLLAPPPFSADRDGNCGARCPLTGVNPYCRSPTTIPAAVVSSLFVLDKGMPSEGVFHFRLFFLPARCAWAAGYSGWRLCGTAAFSTSHQIATKRENQNAATERCASYRPSNPLDFIAFSSSPRRLRRIDGLPGEQRLVVSATPTQRDPGPSEARCRPRGSGRPRSCGKAASISVYAAD